MGGKPLTDDDLLDIDIFSHDHEEDLQLPEDFQDLQLPEVLQNTAPTAVDFFREGIEKLLEQTLQLTGTDSTRIQSSAEQIKSSAEAIAERFAKGTQALIRVAISGQRTTVEGSPDPSAAVPSQDVVTPPKPKPSSNSVKKTPPSTESRILYPGIRHHFFLETFTGDTGYHWINELKKTCFEELPVPKHCPCSNWKGTGESPVGDRHNLFWKVKKEPGGLRTKLIQALDKTLREEKQDETLNRSDLERLTDDDALTPQQRKDELLKKQLYIMDQSGSITNFQGGFRLLLRKLEKWTWYGVENDENDEKWGQIERALSEESALSEEEIRMTPQAVLFVEDCLEYMVHDRLRNDFPKNWGTLSWIAGKGIKDADKKGKVLKCQRRLKDLQNLCLTTEVYERVSKSLNP
jgi:hypothetical protein